MTCELEQQILQRYLEGGLPPQQTAQVEAHLEGCSICQSLPLVPPAFRSLLQKRLGDERAREAFRRSLGRALDPASVPSATPWWQRGLASAWMPRLAMAAVLALLLLVPGRGIFRAPLLAQEVVRSHDFHAATCDGPLPACCTDLGLHPGEPLPAPAAGCAIPDLQDLGMKLLVSSRCSGKSEVARLAYRDERGALFSLYITDRLTEEFHALHPRSLRGRLQAQYDVADREVALWEQDGFVYIWIGPQDSPRTREALAVLQRPN